MRIKGFKLAVTIGAISLVMTGCWTYKHEGFLDAPTPEVPAGLLKGYYVRRFSVNYPSSGFMDQFSFIWQARNIATLMSEKDKDKVVDIFKKRYPDLMKSSEGSPIDIVIKLRSNEEDVSVGWYFVSLGIFPAKSISVNDCEIVVASDRWRGTQCMRLSSEDAISKNSPFAFFAVEKTEEHAVSKNKDWDSVLFIADFEKITKSMKNVFAETLADTVVHIIKTAELKEFENSKKGK
jgi:hypothetical protein